MEKNNEHLSHVRHSLAHLLAAAVLELYPDTLNTIGPAVDNGFYYDFDFINPLSDGDLKEIQKKMKKILSSWDGFAHREVSADDARALFENNKYKLELIDEIADKGEKITLYTAGAGTSMNSPIFAVEAMPRA
jgi:threonyl-tRNA synthetase